MAAAAANRWTCIWYVPFWYVAVRGPPVEDGREAGARTGMQTAAGGRRWKPCGAFVRARHSVLWGGVGRKERHGRPRPFGQMQKHAK